LREAAGHGIALTSDARAQRGYFLSGRRGVKLTEVVTAQLAQGRPRLAPIGELKPVGQRLFLWVIEAPG